MGSLGDSLAKGGGSILNVIDTIVAARQGQLGPRSIQRGAALQDPSFRSSVETSPFLAGLFGLSGGQQAVDMPSSDGMPSPSAPEQQFRAQLPPLGEAGQLELQKTRYGNEKLAAEVPLLKTQAEYGNLVNNILQGRGGAAAQQFGVKQLGPAGATLTPPSPVDITEGTIGPGGVQPAVGSALPGNRIVSTIKADRTARKIGASLDKQIKSLDSAVIGYQELFGDRPDGTSPFDKLSQDETGIEPQLRDVPIIGAFTRGGRFGLPGRPSIAVLANQGDKDAGNIVSGGGLRAIIARMTGEVGNLNETEQKVVADAFLPGENDTKKRAINKREAFFTVARAIREGLTSGQLDQDGAKSMLMAAVDQVSGAPAATSTTATTTPGSSTTTSTLAPQGAAVDPKAVMSAYERLQSGNYGRRLSRQP